MAQSIAGAPFASQESFPLLEALVPSLRKQEYSGWTLISP